MSLIDNAEMLLEGSLIQHNKAPLAGNPTNPNNPV